MLEKHFDTIDANRDGHIVRTELRAWHERQKPLREAERNKRFEARYIAADPNGGGKMGQVDAAEKMPRPQNRFARLEDEREGFLSPAEPRRLVQRKSSTQKIDPPHHTPPPPDPE